MKKIPNILGVGLALVLALSMALVPAQPAEAANVASSGIANPDATLATGLNLADCEVGPIAVTPDGGTLFAAVQTETPIAGIGEGTGAGWVDADLDGFVDDWALLQSTDGGHNWRATGLINNPGPITGIAISSNFATDSTMYVAAGNVPLPPAPAVFRSQDKGVTFVELKAVPAEAALATPTTVINSVDMWPASPYPYVMVGTNTDVWVLQDAPFGVWMDQEINAAGPVNVVGVAFAPDFATTNFIWAVTAAGVVTATNSPGAWGTILANSNPAVTVPAIGANTNACVGFPGDYSSTTNPYLWVGLDGAGANPAWGGVWRVRGLPLPWPSQMIYQLNGVAEAPGVDVRSIAVSGAMVSATILAGLQTPHPVTAGLIVKSTNGGVSWTAPVMKQPTGTGVTYVVMAPDFATSNLAYVGTSDGATTESAFQVSRNGGMSWNQAGLIDIPDTIPPSAVTDLATSNPTVDSITLSWTAPGNDWNTGTASEYDIRYSTSPITETSWDEANQCEGEPTPQLAGSSESFTVTGLPTDTTYYFALKTADEVPNWSGLSNVASGTTTPIDSESPQNAKDYPRYEVGEQNPDGTYQVTINDVLFDTDSGVKKVVAEVDGTVMFEADDINLPEYEFSFVVNLDPVDHTLTIEAWDVVGNYLQKAVSVVVPRVVQATINFDPNTLNLKSKGKVVTVYIELPEGYDVEEIDISSVMLNGIVPALAHPTEVGDYDSDGVPDLMVKFDRSDVQDVLDPGDEVEVTVSGQLTDGTPFEGTDTIRVIEKGKK